jgi:hypothetical protein
MKTRVALLAAVVAAGSLGVGGAALAADGPTRQERCQRMLERIAERRGVTVAELEATIKARMIARLEAAVAAGRIDRKRADALEAKLASGSLCETARGMVQRAHHARHLHRSAVHAMLAGAADYLGLSKQELRAQSQAGKSLAQIAAERQKDVGALKAAMLAKITARLDKAVADGKLKAERRDALLERYGKLADRLIVRTHAPA